MHRPLRVPFHLRVWHLIRGLLFYNTVYWRRASDGLNMPSLSAEERERQRPERNLEIIRPRMRPRAHIEVARGAEVSNPPLASTGDFFVEPIVSEPLAPERDPSLPPAPRPPEESTDDGTQTVYVKRRRYRRQLVARGSAIDRGGFLARVFGKK